MNRRTFLGTAITTTGALALGLHHRAISGAPGLPPVDKKPLKRRLQATSPVPLGKSGIKVSLVGIGTGSIGWNKSSNQTRQGDENFRKLARHALDKGINFFDLADQYGSNPFFGRAMKGVARDKYVIQTKI
ncbi:MAG TPA: aldo/keto reductase, partial [Abditibacteriaceae bacterium]|nr:aldo/keto reductase [Abditibacteriaceae bacterium]